MVQATHQGTRKIPLKLAEAITEVVKVEWENGNFLDKVTPKNIKLKTADDFKKAAKTLKKIAREKLEKSLTTEDKAVNEEKKRKKAELKKHKEKEKKQLERLRIKEEAKKMFNRFKEKERQNIEETIKKKMQTNITIVQTEVRSLTKKIKKLEKEKANFLKKKAFLLEALNFNCPHCKNSCVIFREGNSYLVKRSAQVTIVPEKPAAPKTTISPSSPTRSN